MLCKCGNELRWKAFQERAITAGEGFRAGIMPCTQCGIKHIVANANDEEGINILYNCDRNSWKYEEVKELDRYIKHSCTDFCFYKGRNLYTYWTKGTRNIIVCRNFNEILDRFTL
jgi:hypothetical protein